MEKYNFPITEALKRIHPEKELCNCSTAYYGEDGRCAYGCSSNQIRAKEIIAMAYLELSDRLK